MSLPKYECELTALAVAKLIGDKPSTFLEIGCNDGTDTLKFLDLLPNTHIFCFECDPRAITLFKQNVKVPNITLFDVALDETGGEKLFYQSDGGPDGGWNKSGSLCLPTGHLQRSPEITFPKQILVRTTTLDVWAEVYFPHVMHNPHVLIDFIWMDVQGAELRVLRSGKKTLNRTRYLYLECHEQILYDGQPTEKEIIAELTGWTCLGRYGDNLLFRNEKHARV